MASPDGSLWIAYNGEIYNFRDLRRELEAQGHVFRSQSDTEVVLAAIRQWGLRGALDRFNGMFAFALWDACAGELYLVRDRIGEKPLYYGHVGGVLAFASELGALRRLPGFTNKVDRGALSLLIRYGYIPAPHSIYREIAKLPPGTVLTVRPGRPLDEPRPYWDPAEVAERGGRDPWKVQAEEASEELDGLLRRAVARRLVADVPLGAFLSGGIDSSLVVALMQAAADRPVRTFTIGFSDKAFDEAPYARRVARHLGTVHTELYVEAQDALGVIPKLPELFDEPFSDSSQIPTYLVARLAREHVKVCLTGDGGDELFGGYQRYDLGRDLWRWIGWAPPGLRRLGSRLLRRLPALLPERALCWMEPAASRYGRPGRSGDKLYKLAGLLETGSSDELYRRLLSRWKDEEGLVVGGAEPGTLFDGSSHRPDLAQFEERMMFLDLVTYLPDDILAKVDRTAMAVSLETRLPLLDPEVIELAWRLPLYLKRRGGQGKWLLRQVLYRYVPPELVERPKRGFGVPLGSWLRGPLRDWAEELLGAERLAREGFLRPEPIRRRWREHLSGERDWRYDLWNVLVFQQWLEAQAEPRSRRAPPAPVLAGDAS